MQLITEFRFLKFHTFSVFAIFVSMFVSFVQSQSTFVDTTRFDYAMQYYGSKHKYADREKGHVFIDTQGKNAFVFVNDLPVGRAPVYIRNLAVGKHRVKVKLNRHIGRNELVHIAVDETSQLSFHLQQKQGDIQISGKKGLSGSRVFLNGIERGVAPLVFSALPVGSYLVELRKGKVEVYHARVRVEWDESTFVESQLLPGSAPKKLLQETLASVKIPKAEESDNNLITKPEPVASNPNLQSDDSVTSKEIDSLERNSAELSQAASDEAISSQPEMEQISQPTSTVSELDETTILEPSFDFKGNASLAGHPKYAAVEINGLGYRMPIMMNFKKGEYDFHLRHPGYYKMKFSIAIEDSNEQVICYNMEKVSLIAALRNSASVPGWGQKLLGSKRRAWIWFGAGVTSFAYFAYNAADYLYLNHRAQNAKDSYDNAGLVDADAWREIYQDRYEAKESRKDKTSQAAAIFTAVWAANILDTWLLHRSLNRPSNFEININQDNELEASWNFAPLFLK